MLDYSIWHHTRTYVCRVGYLSQSSKLEAAPSDTKKSAPRRDVAFMRRINQSFAFSSLEAGCLISMRGSWSLHVLPFRIKTLLQSVGSSGA